MIRVYFDLEFTGLHLDSRMISIGMISGDDTFYGEFNDYMYGFAYKDDFEFYLKEIKPGLKFDKTTFRSKPGSVEMKGNVDYVRLQIEKWLKKVLEGRKAEMWSDCLAYDWVLFRSIWGHALDVPSFIHYIPMDLCTLLYTRGIDPDICREEFAGVLSRVGKHNSLHDARIIKLCVERAESLELKVGRNG